MPVLTTAQQNVLFAKSKCICSSLVLQMKNLQKFLKTSKKCLSAARYIDLKVKNLQK